jgi:hypothetical protein
VERPAEEDTQQTPVSNVGIGGVTVEVDLRLADTQDEELQIIQEAVNEIGIDFDFFVRDEKVAHLCVHSTCPYCEMAFGHRHLLMDHLERREQSGGCFSS